MYKSDTGFTKLSDIAVAFALLTRLPLPTLPERAFLRQAQSAWAFPFVGLVVGVLAGAVGYAALVVGLPSAAAAGCVLFIQIVLTGAMHEDGLADTADGLWGGWTKERRLEIMKDSAIGTYGVLALGLSLGLRWVALTALISQGFGPLVAAAVLSRAVLPAMMTMLPSARSDGLSQSVGPPGKLTSILSLVLGISIAWSFTGPAMLLPACGALLMLCALGLVAQSKIGGQTGDILGAAQQIGEIVLLLGFMVVFSG